MGNKERADLNKIRHFKGTVADFKSYWDEMAGKNTNAYDTPEYQGFDNVHPTRGPKQSPHWKSPPWKISSVTEQDHEVKMANNQLEALINAALDLKEKIGEIEKDIPAWIQDHISQSYNYLKQANDGYHEYM
jgi:hypothetical protein